MVHWGFLILAFVVAFIAGSALCYWTIYQCAKAYGQIMGAVEEASRGVRFRICTDTSLIMPRESQLAQK